MEYIIKEEINIVVETCNTLAFIVNEKEKVEGLKTMLKKMDIDSEKYFSRELRDFFSFIEKFKAENNVSMERLRKYFLAVEVNSFSYIADIILGNMDYEELLKIKEISTTMEEAILQELMMKEFLCNFDCFTKESFIKENKKIENVKATFMSYLINETSFRDEVKWNITLITEAPKKYLMEMIDIVIESTEVFKNCFYILKKEVVEAVDNLKEELSKNDNYISEITGIKALEGWERDIVIQPSMINFNSVVFRSDTSLFFNKERKDNMYFGAKFNELMNPANWDNKESTLLLDRLKCLSDKSKYNIIKMLKKGPMFGQEIAAQLGLTTATVSHHMNTLVLCRFVYIERMDNKVYYNINKEEVNNFIKHLASELI